MRAHSSACCCSQISVPALSSSAQPLCYLRTPPLASLETRRSPGSDQSGPMCGRNGRTWCPTWLHPPESPTEESKDREEHREFQFPNFFTLACPPPPKWKSLAATLNKQLWVFCRHFIMYIHTWNNIAQFVERQHIHFGGRWFKCCSSQLFFAQPKNI